jgi:hypothetical protein
MHALLPVKLRAALAPICPVHQKPMQQEPTPATPLDSHQANTEPSLSLPRGRLYLVLEPRERALRLGPRTPQIYQLHLDKTDALPASRSRMSVHRVSMPPRIVGPGAVPCAASRIRMHLALGLTLFLRMKFLRRLLSPRGFALAKGSRRQEESSAGATVWQALISTTAVC